MISGVYKITNLTTGKWYVGSSQNCERRFKEHIRELRGGYHINPPLQNAWNKYGEDDFSFEIIYELPINEAQDKEQSYIDNYYDDIYNTSRSAYHGGDLISTHPNRDDIIARMTASINIRYASITPEQRELQWGYAKGQGNGMYGRRHTEAAKQIMSEAASKRTGELNGFYGRKHTEENKKHLSELASQRTGEKNPFYGRAHTDDAKKRIGEKSKGRIPKNRRPVVIDGIEYESATQAGKELGVVTATILHRIKSSNEKYANYFYK